MITDFRIRKVLSLILLFSSLTLFGYSQELEELEAEDSLLIGLVIDDTVSGIGHEFARSLSLYLSATLSEFEYNLTVHERPSARWGSVVWVTYENKQVFKTILYPGRRTFGEIVERAATQIDNNVRQKRLQELFSQNLDLAGEEI
ncbi:CsgE family curli-type amyloid fiber assembly protein [Microbulbifer sp. 2205BS26-8]|uniref:CsgE family curli-type amyloid fiber assembly protein n=1 Tax=Microbulbifer sp. 2205BS26-8 TaxID=3064386 RepID=UPI00274007D2|nr:CsgE family curli-type amyloid fiber assembly protein [Microbulbifer sp. 2205BS26-8]MDP5209326.1 CsgE family curli-type amyloid fiber assembly protein [Microbulbifer sp. 2205BS26-8]